MMRPSKDLPCVYLCTHPVDFRKAIGCLSLLVEDELALNPFDPTLHNAHKLKLKGGSMRKLLTTLTEGDHLT